MNGEELRIKMDNGNRLDENNYSADVHRVSRASRFPITRASIGFLLILSFVLLSTVISVNAKCHFTCHIADTQRTREELTFEIWLRWSDPVSQRAGEEVERMLRDIGINVYLKPVTDVRFRENFENRRTFQIYIQGGGLSTYPLHLYERLHTNELRFLGTNNINYNNTNFDVLWEAAEEEDAIGKRLISLWEAQGAVAQDIPYIPLFTTDVVYTIRDEWIGFNPMQGGIFNELNRQTTINLSHINDTDADFILAVPSFYVNYSPLLSHDDLSRYLTSLIYDSLVSVGEGLEIIPWLAEEWTISDDGLSVTFEIVQGARWHDGKPLTGEDVKFTLDLLTRYTNLTKPPLFNALEGVQLQGDHSVTLNLEEPYAWTLNDLAKTPILPQHLWNERSINWSLPLDEGIIGSGPFIWNSNERREWIKLEANSEYDLTKWRFQAVLSGEADADFRELDLSFKAEAEADDGLVPLEETRCLSSRDYGLYFNLLFDPAIKDVAFRKAIAYALDNQIIAEAVNPGFAIPSETYIQAEYYGDRYYDPLVNTYEQNIYFANQILDHAGYIDIDADGVREMPQKIDDDTGEGTPEEVTRAKLEALEGTVASFSLSLNETQSLMTSMNEQSKNSLNLTYVMVAVTVLIAAVALFYALRK
jgi:ABC-type transport system substrate-binding protein